MRPPASRAVLVALCGCVHAVPPPYADPVAAPPEGPTGEWVELPLAPAASHYNLPRLHTVGDSAYLLVDDHLYRSDDHGARWALRSVALLADFAPAPDRLLGWTGNEDAPLMVSFDDGRHWSGRPVATYEGDQILSTGAVGSPRLLRVFGAHTVIVSPAEPEALLVSETPPEGFVRGEFRFTPEHIAWAKAENVALDTYTKDLGSHGSDLYACTTAGLFRSRDAARTWEQVPGPEPAPWESCTFAKFEEPFCVAAGRWGGQQLWCAKDAGEWVRADAGLYETTPPHPEWGGYTGLAYVLGTAQLSGAWYLADRGDNPYAPRPEGLYVTRDLTAPWTRVTALDGQQILDVAATSRAVLVLTMGERVGETTPLHLWRYVPAGP